ncbi:MAG: Carboxypeptidase T precursor, partial [uncultured Nocardioidaceae bacterium]
LGAAERSDLLPPPGRLRGRDEGPGRAVPEAREAADAAEQERRGPRGPRHRDHHRRREHRGRQAGVPEHGRPPRPRVAVLRARDGVGARAAHRLRRRLADDADRPPVADHHHPGGQRRRLHHQPRGGRGRRRAVDHGVRVRVQAQELRHLRQHDAGALPHRHLRRQPGRAPARDRPQPQLRRLLGRGRREPQLAERHLPRGRAVLRARDPEHPVPREQPPGHQPHHEPHVLEPGPAGARRLRRKAAARGAAVQGPRRAHGQPQRLHQPAELGAVRHHRLDRGLELLQHRWLRLHLRDRPGRVPPALRAGRGQRVPRPGCDRRSRQGRQPRGVLRDGQGHARPEAAQHADGHRTGRVGPGDLQDLHERDVPGRPAQRHDRRAARVHRHPHVDLREQGWEVHVGGQPVDPAGRRRSLRPTCGRPGPADDHAVQPGRRPGRERGRPRLGAERGGRVPDRGAAGVRQRHGHRGHPVGQHRHRLGPVRPEQRGRGRRPVRAGQHEPGGRAAHRPGTGHLPGRPGELRRRGHRRLDVRRRHLRQPAAGGPHRRQGGLDADLRAAERRQGVHPRGRRRPRADARPRQRVQEGQGAV